MEKPQILSAVSARPETGSASTPSLAPGHTGFSFPSRPFRDPIYTFGVLSVVSPELWPLGSPRPQADMGLFCGIPQSAVTSSGVPLTHSKSYLLIPASGLVPGMQVTPSNCAGERRKGMSSKAGGQEALEADIHCGGPGTSHICKESRGISLAHLSKLW